MISNDKEINELAEILNIFSEVVPDGTKKEIQVDGVTYLLEKDKGELKIEILREEKVENDSEKVFDDTEVKNIVAEFKERINELDDCLFMEILEDLKTKLDIKELDSFLELKSFDKDTANRLTEMINLASDVMLSHLSSKIGDLVKLYNRF